MLTCLDEADLDAVGLAGPPLDAVRRLAVLAVGAGAGALVCSPQEVAAVRAEVGPDVVLITPGVRPAGADVGDQARVATPSRPSPTAPTCSWSAARSPAPPTRARPPPRSPPRCADRVARPLDRRAAPALPAGPRRVASRPCPPCTRPSARTVEVTRVALPPLTPEQRAAALEKAAAARRARAELKVRLKPAAQPGRRPRRSGETDEAIGKMQVLAVLEAMPGVGKIQAAAHHGEARDLARPAGSAASG